MIALSLVASLVYADSVEIKTGNGYKVKTNKVQGTFRSENQSEFPYVCYDKRVKAIIDGEMYLVYKGCGRYNGACKRLGRAHFGKYPNDYKAYKALNRCENATPKFVD